MKILDSLFRRSRSESASPIEGSADAHPKHVTPAGMVQVGSLTYRIFGVTKERYGVTRVLDDRFLGTFLDRPCLVLSPEPGVDERALRDVARAAIRGGRTAWSCPPPVPPASEMEPARGRGFVPLV
ncbi:MAG TPA: hypothetical protein VGK73_29910 [Polyangiaceae bacterium]